MTTAPIAHHTDSRSAKAFAIAADAGQWLRCRTRDGRKLYGIRSQANPNRVYFVTRDGCSCPDFQRTPQFQCKHQLAVRLHCAVMRGRVANDPANAELPAAA